MKKLFLVISVFIGLLLTNIDCQAQKVGGELGNLAAIKKGFRNRRISSTDKNGNNGDWIDSIKPGEKWSVAISGTGIINHIWFTISPMNLSLIHISEPTRP